ncbi:MAG: hypothetical protein K8R77_16375 [Anaerolineaceae bacterium]|nr:hypothetical protein [Anaerolineaceae bacterium]
MGLDYSFVLYFKRQDPWHLLEGAARFADHDLKEQTAILYPGEIMRLPFEAWAGTEKKLPIPYDDDSKEWDFMTSLYFDPDEPLRDFVERNGMEDVYNKEQISIGYIYLTVYNDWREYDDSYDPNLIRLQFMSAGTRMSILFAESLSMRRAFTRYLRDYQGVYGLLDREMDAVLFWLRGEEMDVAIPDAWMGLKEIEDYLSGEQ